mmetsp:Transcript_9993/g.29515  ORF Transcript_9993/g.29515 Transcript_9993/m.29515 type:complete len:293 (-) Transcript_9993:126-1004(-)
MAPPRRAREDERGGRRARDRHPRPGGLLPDHAGRASVAHRSLPALASLHDVPPGPERGGRGQPPPLQARELADLVHALLVRGPRHPHGRDAARAQQDRAQRRVLGAQGHPHHQGHPRDVHCLGLLALGRLGLLRDVLHGRRDVRTHGLRVHFHRGLPSDARGAVLLGAAARPGGSGLRLGGRYHHGRHLAGRCVELGAHLQRRVQHRRAGVPGRIQGSRPQALPGCGHPGSHAADLRRARQVSRRGHGGGQAGEVPPPRARPAVDPDRTMNTRRQSTLPSSAEWRRERRTDA